MATNDEKDKVAADPEETIEDLAARNKVPNWVMSGLKAAYNWGAGKRLTEKEFLEKRDAWLKGPMSRA